MMKQWIYLACLVCLAGGAVTAGLVSDQLPPELAPKASVESEPVVPAEPAASEPVAIMTPEVVSPSPVEAAVPVMTNSNTEAISAPSAVAVEAPVTDRELPPAKMVKKAESSDQAMRRRPFTAVAALGRSDGEVITRSIILDYHFDKLWQWGRHGYVNPYSEFVLSFWEGEKGHTGVSSLHEAGASVLLRYRFIRKPYSIYHPYVDAGFGLHYLTEDQLEGKELGRNWQAGSNIGIGLLFSRAERFELGVRLRHLSNAGTDEFNWGVNQLMARFGIRF